MDTEERLRRLEQLQEEAGIPLFDSTGKIVGIVVDLQAFTGITLSRSGRHGKIAAGLEPRQRIFMPDAAPGVAVTAGSGQGPVFHTDANGETATKLYVDAKTAPGANGLPITIEYADTNDLDTVTLWQTVCTYTLSSEMSNFTTTMVTPAIPGNRMLRLTVGVIVGTPKDVNAVLETKVNLA